jgi:membrane-associated phospholipid phosphatase
MPQMPVYAWDVRWLLWVNHSEHQRVFDAILKPIALYGYWGWLALLVFILFFDRPRGKLVFLLGVIAWGFSSYLGDTVLKPLVKHPRPSAVASLASELRVLVPVPSSPSFPASAAMLSFAVAGVIAFFYSGWKRWAALAAAAAIAYARVYVGVHFPSDVIGGAAIGLFVGAIGTALQSRWWKSASAPPPRFQKKPGNAPPKSAK